MNRIPALCIGTANFGKKYGILNRNEQIPSKDIPEIFKEMIQKNVEFLDTAPGYGDSETIIGQYSNLTNKMKVITKIGLLDNNRSKPIHDSVNASLERMNMSKIWGLLIHNTKILFDGDSKKLIEEFKEMKDKGLVERIGASVYSEIELERVLDIFSDLDLIQIPENVCDQSKFDSNLLINLKSANVEIFVRSIFLQGILLNEFDELPKIFNEYEFDVQSFFRTCRKTGRSPKEICLDYAKSIPWCTGVVVGVDSISQLVEVSGKYFQKTELDRKLFKRFPNWLLDPRNWS